VPYWHLSKSKISGLPLCKFGNLILKIQHSITRQAKQKISGNLIITEAKNAYFFVFKRTGLVHQEPRDFVKMTLIRVSSHWLWRESSHSIINVTRVESNHHFSQLDPSQVRITQNRDTSHWLESRYHWLLLNKWLIKSLVWQTFSLLVDVIDSERYLGYTICQACKICQVCLGSDMTGPKWHKCI